MWTLRSRVPNRITHRAAVPDHPSQGKGTSIATCKDHIYQMANLHNYVLGNGQSAVTDNQAWNAESTPSNGPWDGLEGEYCGKT